MNALNFILKVIRVRKHIISLDSSQKNKAKCTSIIRILENTTSAYSKIWNDDAWKRFILRKLNEIIFLIPENNKRFYTTQLNTIINDK